MKYKDFKKKLENYPYFTSSVYGALTASPNVLHNQVNKWVSTGDVLMLRRGLYTLNAGDRKAGLSKRLLANILYSPSYISLEYALHYYDMIPEAVFAITSVSTRKTKEFTNKLGHFIYKSIKAAAFTGFTSVKDEFGFNCLIATPEKAILDYLYFSVPATQKLDDTFFDGSLRLQNQELIDPDKLMGLAKEMKSKKILKFVDALMRWLRKE